MNLFTATLQQSNILTLQTKPAVTLMKEQKWKQQQQTSQFTHTWKPNGRLMRISCPVLYSYNSHCELEREREKLNDMWVIWKIWIYETKWPFSCPYLSVCSAEALAFRGVLCRERDELFSEWYFKRSIFHTINLSNCDTSRSTNKCGWARHETPLKWSRDEKNNKNRTKLRSSHV